MQQILGKLTVTTPGTLVRATRDIVNNTLGLRNDVTKFSCHAVLFQALSTNVGLVYIGGSALVRASLANCGHVLAVPTTNILPSFGISLTNAPAGVNLSDLYIDADNANDGVLIMVLVQ